MENVLQTREGESHKQGENFTLFLSLISFKYQLLRICYPNETQNTQHVLNKKSKVVDTCFYVYNRYECMEYCKFCFLFFFL